MSDLALPPGSSVPEENKISKSSSSTALENETSGGSSPPSSPVLEVNELSTLISSAPPTYSSALEESKVSKLSFSTPLKNETSSGSANPSSSTVSEEEKISIPGSSTQSKNETSDGPPPTHEQEPSPPPEKQSSLPVEESKVSKLSFSTPLKNETSSGSATPSSSTVSEEEKISIQGSSTPSKNETSDGPPPTHEQEPSPPPEKQSSPPVDSPPAPPENQSSTQQESPPAPAEPSPPPSVSTGPHSPPPESLPSAPPSNDSSSSLQPPSHSIPIPASPPSNSNLSSSASPPPASTSPPAPPVTDGSSTPPSNLPPSFEGSPPPLTPPLATLPSPPASQTLLSVAPSKMPEPSPPAPLVPPLVPATPSGATPPHFPGPPPEILSPDTTSPELKPPPTTSPPTPQASQSSDHVQKLNPPTSSSSGSAKTESSKDSSDSNGSQGSVISVAVAGVVVIGLIALVFVILRKRKKREDAAVVHYKRPPISFSVRSDGYYYKQANSTGHSGNSDHYGTKPPASASTVANGYGSNREHGLPESDAIGNSKSCFRYEELMDITDGFSRKRILGEGGFGSVYKGQLTDGRKVAVKQLRAGSGQGEREFRAEVEIISRVHHRHLVSLVGYCIAEHHRLLVYEFVPNKTLEHHLHGNGMPVMEWSKRMKIAIGAARGLAYLHEDCHPRIIHRDIKSANILLDDSFEAQVADFGLAKLSNDTNTHVSTRVMGTFGYMAPEYASSGKLTDRSDVFSFGVVLLELVTGRKPVDPSQPLGDESLVEWARPLLISALETGEMEVLADPRLEKNYVPREMFQMIEAAAACVRHSAPKRPRMVQVLRALDTEGDNPDLSNGVKYGQSTVFNSGEYNAEIQRFQRMAFASNGSVDYIISEYDNNSSVYSGEYLYSSEKPLIPSRSVEPTSGEASSESETRPTYWRSDRSFNEV